jgi:hypothetical protein
MVTGYDDVSKTINPNYGLGLRFVGISSPFGALLSPHFDGARPTASLDTIFPLPQNLTIFDISLHQVSPLWKLEYNLKTGFKITLQGFIAHPANLSVFLTTIFTIPAKGLKER